MKLGQLQIAAFLIFSLASIGVIAAQNITDADNATNITLSIDLCAGIVCKNSSIACADGYIAACRNTCEAGICSNCTPNCDGHEITPIPMPTDNITNETTPTPTPIENATNLENVTKPDIYIQLLYPEKVTRNTLITLAANITNSGNATARNLAVNWQLPADFAIVSRQGNCVNLEPSSACTSEIAVQASLSAKPGPNAVKVVVSYD